MWLFLAGFAAILAVYLLHIKPYSYWKKRNIPTQTPWPILGNLISILSLQSISELIQNHYNIYKDNRYFGFYQLLRPVLYVKDPEIIKLISIKEFDAFPEHPPFVSEDADPLWAKNLVAMKGGEKWRNMRATLSPAFTTSKLKNMFKLLDDCAQQFSQYFMDQKGFVTVEMKDVFSRFTNDAIASAAFGVTCDSMKYKDNEFYLMGKNATNFGGLRQLKFFGNDLFPSLMKVLNVKIFDENTRNFFSGIVKDTIKLRETKNIVRPDMIHLLLEARKGKLKYEEQPNASTDFAAVEESSIGKSSKINTYLTDEDITAQAFVFFLGGFDAVSTLMSHTAYELALNQDIQDRLYAEIKEALSKCEGNFTYEVLSGMKYLDMIVSESLRKWPPTPLMNRISVKDIELPPERSSQKPLLVEKGTVVLFPAFALHRDPKYFPNPEKFDPERFSEKNRDKIVPCSYIPFGSGPRNCIGSRFALLEAKIVMVRLVDKFQIVPVEKSQIPLKLSRRDFNLLPEKGFWLGLKAR